MNGAASSNRLGGAGIRSIARGIFFVALGLMLAAISTYVLYVLEANEAVSRTNNDHFERQTKSAGAQKKTIASGPATGVVTGRVVDEHRQPIAECSVSFFELRQIYRLLLQAGPPYWMMLRDGATPAAEVTTRANGTFKVTLPEGRYVAYYLARGYAPFVHRTIAVEDGRENSSNDAQLVKGRTIAGVVRDASGEPIVGASVLCITDSRAPGSARAQSDAAGAFAIQDLPDETAALLVEADSFEPVLFEAKPPLKRDLQIILQPARTIVLRVTDAVSKVPISDVHIRASPVDRERWYGARELKAKNPQGVFELSGLTKTDYEIGVFAEGYAPFIGRVNIQSHGEQPLSIAMRKGGEVAGHVASHHDKNPLQGVTIKAYLLQDPEPSEDRDPSDSLSREMPLATATSDEKGHYVIPNLPQGKYRIETEHPQLVRGLASSLTIEEGRTSACDFGGRISGKTPWAFMDVLVVGDNDFWWIGFSDATSEFDVPAVPPGRYLLYCGLVSDPAKAYSPKPAVVKEHETTEVRVRAIVDEMPEPDKKRLLLGWVTDDSNTPLPKMKVFCQAASGTGHYLRAATTDATGFFSFAEVLPESAYALVAVPDDDPNAVRRITSVQVATRLPATRKDIVLPRGRISGLVLSDGKAVADCDVQLVEVLEGDAQVPLASRRTDASGQFAFTCVPKGRYQLHAFMDGFYDEPAEVVLSESETVVENRQVLIARAGSLTVLIEDPRSDGADLVCALRSANGATVATRVIRRKASQTIEFKNLKPGSYKLDVADRSGASMGAAEFEVRAAETTTGKIVIER